MSAEINVIQRAMWYTWGMYIQYDGDTCTGERETETRVERHLRANSCRARFLRVSDSGTGQPDSVDSAARTGEKMRGISVLFQSHL